MIYSTFNRSSNTSATKKDEDRPHLFAKNSKLLCVVFSIKACFTYKF